MATAPMVGHSVSPPLLHRGAPTGLHPSTSGAPRWSMRASFGIDAIPRPPPDFLLHGGAPPGLIPPSRERSTVQHSSPPLHRLDRWIFPPATPRWSACDLPTAARGNPRHLRSHATFAALQLRHRPIPTLACPFRLLTL